MIYLLIIPFALILFIVIINYLRKLHWDVIHNNLFDLVDKIGGKVIRRGFLARPVFYGTYRKCEITINFSQEKKENGRKNYINISINKIIKHSLSIVSLEWLKSQNESTDGLYIFEIGENIKYGLRSKNKNGIKKNSNKEKIKRGLVDLHSFNYLFMGETGIIYEMESQNIAIDTKHPKLHKQINTIYNFSQNFK